MSYAILSIILGCWGIQASGASSRQNEDRPTPVYKLYELYSWEDTAHGTWNFSILYNTSREKSVKEVFDKKAVLGSVDRLKEKISSMPVGSKIIWRDELLSNGKKQKGSEALQYPPEKIIQDVKRFAQEHGIDVLGPFRAGEN